MSVAAPAVRVIWIISLTTPLGVLLLFLLGVFEDMVMGGVHHPSAQTRLIAGLVGIVPGIMVGFLGSMLSGRYWFALPAILACLIAAQFLMILSMSSEAGIMRWWQEILNSALLVFGLGVGTWLAYLVFIKPLPEGSQLKHNVKGQA